jgi:Domain of unknown function (DUF4383)
MSMLGLRNLPEDHRFNWAFRFGGGLIGLVLFVFGLLGFAGLDFVKSGDRVAGLSTNVVLSIISVVVGLVLIGAAAVGGNVAADVNLLVGALFLLSGLANLAVLRTSVNFLNFSMSNVIFSFVVGMILLTFGLYGRVSGGEIPADGPFLRGGAGERPARQPSTPPAD